MIESVSTSSVQSATLRYLSQSTSALQAEVEAASSASLPSMRIRMDNQLDRAIIEVRASDSGQVLRQYPSEAQLRAYARAEALKVARQHVQTAELDAELSGGSNAGKSAPKVEVQVQQQSAAPAPSSDVSAALNGSAPATQSIEI